MSIRQLEPFQAEAIRLALVKMFSPDSYFDICTVDKVCKIANVIPPTRERDTLSALHCVHWSRMTQAMREETIRRTLALLDLPDADVAELRHSLMPDHVRPVEVAVAPRPRNAFLRLIGGN